MYVCTYIYIYVFMCTNNISLGILYLSDRGLEFAHIVIQKMANPFHGAEDMNLCTIGDRDHTRSVASSIFGVSSYLSYVFLKNPKEPMIQCANHRKLGGSCVRNDFFVTQLDILSPDMFCCLIRVPQFSTGHAMRITWL